MSLVAALRAAALAATVAVLPSAAPSGAALADTAVFAGLSGAWSGGGMLKLSSGEKERLRCKASYQVSSDGNGLQQHLRCASDSYRFDVDSKIVYNADAGVLSGTWAETNYGSGGFVTGRVSTSQIEAKVDGGSFSAAISVSLRGGQHSVLIRAADSTISEVSVTLHRA
jgi:hypothetical protein